MRKTAAFACALLGLFVSIYLLWMYASPSHPMVCLGTGCDLVRSSKYAHLFGIPTPAYGVLMYAVLAALIFVEASKPRASGVRNTVLAIAAAGVIVSAVLTYIEAALLHAWCAWCVTQALAVVLIFILWFGARRVEYATATERKRAQGRYWNVLMVGIIAGAAAFYGLARAESQEAAPPPAADTIAEKLIRPDSHVSGNAQSPVTFVEFGDLQCPACAASYPIVRDLRTQYGDRVKFVFRHYPLPTIHPFALHTAQASECAAQQGRFWEYVDRAYDAKGDLKDESLERYAGELGLDKDRFHQCLATNATLPQVQRDELDGNALGVRSTPTFFVGQRRIVGALTSYQFTQLLLEDLDKAGMLKTGAAPPPAEPAATSKTSEPTKTTEKKALPQSGATLSMGGGGSSGGFFDVKGASTDCSADAPKGPEPPLIHTADAQKKVEQGAVFVDVRSADDYSKGHIKSARSIPLLEVERRAGELPKGKPIVVYEAGTAASGDVCAAAKSAARVLVSRGYKAVVYQDGLKDWEKAGGPVEK